jgi:hypothetical protein
VLTVGEGSPEYSRDVLTGIRPLRPGPSSVRSTSGAARSALVLVVLAVLSACAADPPSPSGNLTQSTNSPGLISGGGVTRSTAVPVANRPKCTFPDPIETPDWLPKDLPFPAGAYTFQELSTEQGFHKSVMVVPGDLAAWAQFVLDEWPKSGYFLGRGDAEPGEIEDVFQKSPSVGAFKAVYVYCKPGYSKMLIIYADQSPGLPVLPAPSGTPLNPTASP